MTLGDVVVHPVQGRAGHRVFCELPWRLHAGDPFWVPPLRGAEFRRWSPRHNPSLLSRRVARFVAWRGREAVGRIALVRDPAFAERWSPGAGFFGFFECGRDEVAARSLLAAAEESARGWNLERLFGPVNLTTHEEVGFLVEGFDSRPMILSPWNPPAWPEWARAAGYRPALELKSYEWKRGWRPAESARRRRDAMEGADDRLVIRAGNARRFEEEARLMLDLYNASFADNWGFVPLTWPEFRQRASEFRPFYRPELVLFAEMEGEPVGFALTLPDVNEALAEIGGKLWPFGWWRLMRRVPRLRAARFILLGVLPRVARQGVAFRLAWRMMEAAEAAGIERAELSLVMTPNDRMRRFIEESYGWPVVKRYQLFEKELAP